jgi:D-amino-acid dehydrogenase
VLKWLGREDAPLLWRFSADPSQWSWGLRFLRECCPKRTRANIRAILALALDSRSRLKALRQELALDYQCLERGILHFYTDPAEFARAIPQAALMREFGCERVIKTATECLDIEPALAHSAAPIVGGTYTADDESGDAQLFTTALAEHCAARGVQFRYDTTVAGLDAMGDQVSSLLLSNGEKLSADAYVVALGSYSTLLLRPLGLDIPVYPAKGYSISVPLKPTVSACEVSLIDDEAKMVYSRLGERLRVAGTAEFNGYDTSLNSTRIYALIKRTRQIFPQLEFSDAAVEPWAGLRPATPSNVPLIGATRLKNLYLNTGHGTLGWTMAVGSGQLLADQIAGRAPEIDPLPYLP